MDDKLNILPIREGSDTATLTANGGVVPTLAELDSRVSAIEETPLHSYNISEKVELDAGKLGTIGGIIATSQLSNMLNNFCQLGFIHMSDQEFTSITATEPYRIACFDKDFTHLGDVTTNTLISGTLYIRIGIDGSSSHNYSKTLVTVSAQYHASTLEYVKDSAELNTFKFYSYELTDPSVKDSSSSTYDGPNLNRDYNNGWIDRNTRVALLHALDVVELSGGNIYTVWFNEVPLTLDIATIKLFLNALELYAIEALNVTNQHILQVKLLLSIEEVENFDITQGYPNKIELNL